jgi:hypothetical protein
VLFPGFEVFAGCAKPVYRLNPKNKETVLISRWKLKIKTNIRFNQHRGQDFHALYAWRGVSVLPTRMQILLVRWADATDAPQPWGFLCNPMMKMIIIIFCPFPSHGAPVEWNWQGKTEVLGEKPVPVPLCPPQIPHGLTRYRPRASAVGGRRLTAWAMARPVGQVSMSDRYMYRRRAAIWFHLI